MKTESSIAKTTKPNTVAGSLRTACAARLLPLLLLTLSAAVQAQDYNYAIYGAVTITITKYTGSGGVVTIPGTINDLPVTSSGDEACYDSVKLTPAPCPWPQEGGGR